MKDLTGREIKIGDIVAIGQRSGNSGHLVIRVIAGYKTRENRYTDGYVSEPKTTIGTSLQYGDRAIIVPKAIFAGTVMEAEIERELSKIPL